LSSSDLKGREKVCISKLCFKENEPFLNVGCGELGIIENHAAKAGCFVVAVDIKSDVVSRAKLRCDKRIEFIIASATHLPFRSCVFDKVSMLEVLEHLPKRKEKMALQSAYDVLKDCGRFLLSTPHKRFLFTVLDPAFFLMGHRHYSKNELSMKIEEIGFIDARMSTYGGIGEAIIIPVFYLLKKMKLCGNMMPSCFLKQIDKEYTRSRDDGYTIILECRKGLDK
jgi:ubiquinone/menaquinone biosynthesis C-methylase UbiE